MKKFLGLIAALGFFYSNSSLLAEAQQPRPAATVDKMQEGKFKRVEEKFFAAIERGDISAVEHLLKAGLDPNARDDFEKTALMVAAEAGRPEMVKLLLSKGADKKLKFKDSSSKEKTAYDLAEAAGKQDAANLLK